MELYLVYSLSCAGGLELDLVLRIPGQLALVVLEAVETFQAGYGPVQEEVDGEVQRSVVLGTVGLDLPAAPV